MFFEEESKDTHRDMDDYDLNLGEVESADWNKLLGDNAQGNVSEEIDMTQIPDIQGDDNPDSLFDMDEESFENFIQDKKVDIAKNRKEMEETGSFEGIDMIDEASVINLDALASADVNEVENSEPELSQQRSANTQAPIMQETSMDQLFDNSDNSGYTDNNEHIEQEDDYENNIGIYGTGHNFKNKKNNNKSSLPILICVLIVSLLFVGAVYYQNTTGNSILSYLPKFNNDEMAESTNTDTTNDISSIEGGMENSDFSPTDNPATFNIPESSNTVVNTPTVSGQANQPKVNLPVEKVNLKIVDTGKQNPFVPAGNLNNIGFMTNPKIDVVPPFTKLAPPDPNIDKLMQIVVSGILYDGTYNPSAVINVSGTDYFVQKGDKIDTFTVLEITRDKVLIKDKSNIFTASIGQNFTTTGAIEGQIKTIGGGRYGAHRQYVTPADIGINNENEN